MSKVRNWRRRMPSPAGRKSASEAMSPEAMLRAAVASDARTEALCAQVRHVLESVISAEMLDAALEDLIVIEVIPAPNARRLRVLLRFSSFEVARDPEYVMERLVAARGFLRSRVAGEIHRKRTPSLVFELLPARADGARDEVEFV